MNLKACLFFCVILLTAMFSKANYLIHNLIQFCLVAFLLKYLRNIYICIYVRRIPFVIPCISVLYMTLAMKQTV